MKEKFSLKDHLFNETKVRYLASLLASADSSFKADEFVAEVMSRLPGLELKDRIRWIAEVLERYLPKEYEAAVGVILESQPPPLESTRTDDDFGDFIFAPFGEYLAKHGCTVDRFGISFGALEELTMRFSMEDAVRAFVRAFPQETLAQMHSWTTHDNYHVRRLVSEGTRLQLPWSARVPLQSKDTLPLLTILHTDTTRYVTRSVANHLNDIAKSESQTVINILKEWQIQALQSEKELAWMKKHALRTLIKQGNKEALELLGYVAPAVVVGRFWPGASQAKISPGDTLELSVTLKATADTKLLIDYAVHFVKKNGSTVPKVFKWKEITLVKGETVTLTKRHTFKADATTFTLYPGQHKVELQVNGLVLATTIFILTN